MKITNMKMRKWLLIQMAVYGGDAVPIFRADLTVRGTLLFDRAHEQLGRHAYKMGFLEPSRRGYAVTTKGRNFISHGKGFK